MMVTMRSIMRLSGPPRPPTKAAARGRGGLAWAAHMPGVDGGPGAIAAAVESLSEKDISRGKTRQDLQLMLTEFGVLSPYDAVV